MMIIVPMVRQFILKEIGPPICRDLEAIISLLEISRETNNVQHESNWQG